MDPSPSPRKRGAPKGNQNAYKHGFYSSRPKVKEHISPSAAAGRLQPDINFFRLALLRLLSGLVDRTGPPPTLADNLALLHLVTVSVARLNGLWHTNARLFAEDPQSLFAALRRLGFSQEQLDTEFFVKDRKTWGGQTGNSNALKYGLYSHAIPTAEAARLEQESTPVKDEVTLLRVILLRTSMSYSAATDIDFKLRLKTMRLIERAIGVIEKLERTRGMAFTLPAPASLDETIDRIIRELRPQEPESPS